MIQYIFECIAFQLVFLIIYDFFLKGETFFQWNRAYLIGTYVLSMVLPWIKIEAFKSAVPNEYYVYPEFFWNLNTVSAIVTSKEDSQFTFSFEYAVFISGMLLAILFFVYKLNQIHQLRRKGQVHYFPNFTRVVVKNSELAFSFFRSIFLGDRVLQREHENIIQHELVHIRQRHTWDLLFFELMRILGWFNPLVYVYQNRVSELHEFIADSQVAKTHATDHYETLLSQVFQTENISFINQFFKNSLIKKRIVMLQKVKSKSISKLKYLSLVPMVMGILFYTSCEREIKQKNSIQETISVRNIESLTHDEETKAFSRLRDLSEQPQEWSLVLKDKNTTIKFTRPQDELSGISGPGGTMIKAKMHIESKILDENFDLFKNSLSNEYIDVPFAIIEEVPVFPGCEDATDKRACFNEKLQEHISENFRYPEQAQKEGIQGRVSILFVIGKDGDIISIRQRGPHKLLENEANRIISLLPKMKPGKQKGGAVRVPFSIPITFKLGNPSEKKGDENTIKSNSNVMAVSAQAMDEAGKKYLYGKVTDGAMGLPGVNITVKDKERGTITNFDGAFKIEVKEGEVLSFQFKGLPTATLVVGDQKEYNIQTTN